jgi:N-methylhydantoinase B/oxoprolinase/acetone carboxylase alpha subunit
MNVEPFSFGWLTNVGGGYGHPWDRDPALVMHDIAEGHVSEEAAAMARHRANMASAAK